MPKNDDGPHRLAMRCATECLVGYLTARDVLFRGKRNPSNAVKRVLAWSKENRIPLAGGQGLRKEADALETALQEAEREVGLR